ncbi:MAG: SRPBCC domain-containing protein [Dehalococcoidia bacterium]
MNAKIEITAHETEEDNGTGKKLERTFVVAVPVERAWRAMTHPKELAKWSFPRQVAEDGSTETEILGETRTSEVLEFEPGRMFRTRTELTGSEGWGIIPGAREMTVVFEATDTGTRITITHSGFGERADLSGVSRGVDETIADLILYLETGVAFPRHHHGERSWIGFSGGEVRAGLEVRSVQPGTFAQRLGLKAGDLLVELGGASVFGFAEVQFFTKEHGPGEHAEAAWVRDGQLMRGSAELGPRIAVVRT